MFIHITKYANLALGKNQLFACRYAPQSLTCANFSSKDSKNELQPASKKEEKLEAIQINFRDTKTAYIGKSTKELIRASLVLHMCTYNSLVKYNRQLLKISRKLLGKTLFSKLMKSTFYGHFVAGEDQHDIKPYIKKAREYGVKSILDYSVEEDVDESEAVNKVKESLAEVVNEPQVRPKASTKKYRTSIKHADRSKEVVSARTYFYKSEAQCDKNMYTFLECIDAVSGSTNKEGFAAIKLTALGRPQFLLQMSDFLVQLRSLFELIMSKSNVGSGPLQSLDPDSFKEKLTELGFKIDYDDELKWFTLLDTTGDGKIDMLDWTHLTNLDYDYASIFQVKNKETGAVEQLVPSLTREGMQQMRNMIRRIDTIAEHAKETGVRVMVDAEQTYFQPAIRRLVLEMMRRFNTESCIIYNTYQCYLKDAYNQLALDLKLAEQENFYFGAKLVRGAYMEQERARALDLGYDDPINPTYDATTDMYQKCLEHGMDVIRAREKGLVSIMVATHNERTVQFAIDKMAEYGVKPEHRVICFGQLLGMCDQITYSLGQNGYSVYKYVPYGPVEEVLPYLSRRATENQSILGGTAIERVMLRQELSRRLKTGNLLYRP